jgi:hypothetical protein
VVRTAGFSLFMIALGAILKFAVTAQLSRIKLSTVGVILIVVGAIGLVVSVSPYRAGMRG